MASEAEIRASAANAFQNHVIEVLSRDGVYRTWRCGKPDCSIYHFVITTIPGSLIITGDLGSLIVSRQYDMLPWCRGSCDSTGYFAEKVPNEVKTTEFSYEALQEWVKETRKEYGELDDEDPDDEDRIERRDRFDELCDLCNEDMSETEAYELFSDYFDDSPNWHRHTSRFLWLREAIRWFLTNCNDDPIQRPNQ
ncbi:MAG: hypothetical protein NT138_00825 [Planctomycetales bacterium]|nr:hypothetical protein [Planctomycetales bacterium]